MAENQIESKENDLDDFDPSSICLDMKKLVRAEYGLAKERAIQIIIQNATFANTERDKGKYCLRGWERVSFAKGEIDNAITWLTFHTKSRYDPETEMIWLED